MAKKQTHNYQHGAVSLFAVILSALLLTVLTVGFISLMIQGQRQALNNDLSQSAYDSALAGVEDAKRVIRACQTGGADACQALYNEPSDCKIVARAKITGSTAEKETVIRSSIGTNDGSQFDQAYTCVNIDMDTPDYLFTSREGISDVVPLRAAGAFDRVVIEWYTQDDAGAGKLAGSPAATPNGSGMLPQKSAWNTVVPPMLRVQAMTPGDSFSISSLNSSGASQTVFLYPGQTSNGASDHVVQMSGYPRATGDSAHSNEPVRMARCSSNYANLTGVNSPDPGSGYSCKATLTYGTAISQAASANTLLRLQTLYKGASVRVTLYNGTAPVQFRGVQPTVDSTGRANDLFRRVEARLATGETFDYPNYAVDTAGDICKDFSVTDTKAEGGTCTP